MRAAAWWLVVAVACAAPACDPSVPSHHPFPQVPTRDGALLSPLHLVTIVPGNDSADAFAFFNFSAFVGTTAWWRRIAPEYGLGQAVPFGQLMGSPIVADVTDHDVFTYISDTVEANGGPARDGHTLYLLYLPPGINVIQAGTANTACHLFAAYHARYGDRGDNLAVVQRCTETYPIENMTIAASHEIIEAATDPDQHGYIMPPIARQPWTETVWNAFDLQGRAELADLCESTYFVENQSVFQRIWSNGAAGRGGDPCIPELPEPYYATDTEQEWYAVTAGGQVTIPVRGWATGDVAPWALTVAVQGSVDGFSAAFVDSPSVVSSGGSIRLAASAPAGAPSGSFAVIRIASRRPPALPGMRALTDGAHYGFVGLYVP
jgi:hypothetical protein